MAAKASDAAVASADKTTEPILEMFVKRSNILMASADKATE